MKRNSEDLAHFNRKNNPKARRSVRKSSCTSRGSGTKSSPHKSPCFFHAPVQSHYTRRRCSELPCRRKHNRGGEANSQCRRRSNRLCFAYRAFKAASSIWDQVGCSHTVVICEKQHNCFLSHKKKKKIKNTLEGEFPPPFKGMNSLSLNKRRGLVVIIGPLHP